MVLAGTGWREVDLGGHLVLVVSWNGYLFAFHSPTDELRVSYRGVGQIRR